MTSYYPVILSGGYGSRLWPLSRKHYPKQFLPLASEQTMIQETVSRVVGEGFADPLVICSEVHRFIVAEQLQAMGVQPGRIILEPMGKNTAPAAAVAALEVMKRDPNGIVLMLPADHVIANAPGFQEALAIARTQAQKDKLVTFGITPSSAETGYGYIKKGREITKQAFHVDRFVEKPNKTTAKQYIKEGDYFWNSGIFAFKASVYLQELANTNELIVKACEKALNKAKEDTDFLRLDEAEFAKSPEDSIDYAVMERTQHAVMVEADIGWSDIGSWSALWDASDKDAHGNAMIGDVIAHESRNNFVHSKRLLTAILGVENLNVIVTDDAVLIAHRDHVQGVKEIVNQLKSDDRSEASDHRKVFRPWGYYDSLYHGKRTQVKELHVKPGAKLSLQKHFHRAEHWVVTSGTALVHRGDDHILVPENESVFIPIGMPHRIENPGKIPLVIIEVQTGEYLGEDDIVRFEDDFGRAGEQESQRQSS